MLARLTSKNQLTLPRSVTETIGPTEYFEVEAVNGQIILTPVRIQRGDAVRAKLAEPPQMEVVGRFNVAPSKASRFERST